MMDITETAICITRELYEMEGDNPIREFHIGGDIGYCAEREAIAELARVFDAAYDNLEEDIRNSLDPWDMDMVPYLLACAVEWSDLFIADAILSMEKWVALDQIERRES